MAAVLPRKPVPSGGIATEHSPSFTLPLRFFLFGVAGYVAFTIGMAALGLGLSAGGTWTPHLLALTHLLALGFILPMIMGACYQLVPVVMLATIRHESLGKLGFYPYALGVVLLVAGFWSWSPTLLGTGGTLVTVGVGVFLLTLALALSRGAEGGPVGGFVYASLGALALAVLLGILRVASFVVPDRVPALPPVLTAHAGLATLGCASLLIYGVAYRLVPMFAVGIESLRLARPVLWTGGLGTVAIAIGSMAAVPLAVQTGAGLAALAAWLWAFDARKLFSDRTRRRLDAGLTYAAASIAVLLVAALWLVAIAWSLVPAAWAPRAAIALGVLGLLGWVGFTIVGYFHKILPFLAWYHRYSHLLGKAKVPLIRDLFDERSTWIGLGVSQAGLGVVVGSVMLGQEVGVQAGGVLLTVGAIAIVRMVKECLTR